MDANPFQVEVDGGVLHGHTGGKGAPALLLHGGPGLPDYLEGCADDLGRLFTTIRYTQRGVAPTTVGGPYSVETHMADALAVLDAFELEKAWAVGHSWGGHLALHLAVAHPERLHGIVCIGTLGVSGEVLPDFAAALKRDLGEEQLARLAEIDEHEEDGTVTEDELLEQLAIVWPNYFANPANAPPCPFKALGVECHVETFTSIREHFEQKTLRRGLRKVQLPVLFVHGILDPLPLRGAVNTAKLIPRARVARVARCGHLPWIEQPGFIDRAIRGLLMQL